MTRFIIFSCAALLLSLSSVLAQPETQIQYLSGTDKDHTIAWDFFCTGGRNSGHWTTIQVPSCWELQGFGTYNYGRDFFTYGSKLKLADEQGLYKYQFSVPLQWKKRDVWIVFEGSMTDTEVKINGQKVGDTHQGAFYEFKYNITDKLCFGVTNTLEVTVSKMSANKTVNNAERLADYWIFGGIFRPVYLTSYPKQYISHLAVDAKADGNFLLDIATANVVKELSLTANVSFEGKVVATFSEKVKVGEGKSRIQGVVPNVKVWTGETPHMYKVEVTLSDGKKAIHRASDVFGFRTIEVRKGDGIYLNGTKIKMKGVNRHVFWPETGRTVSREVALLDIERVKGMNMNAIRCSHYPPDKSFLYLCDSLGIYVLDELTGWQKFYETSVGEKLVKEMVERDMNHPSIIFWSNGNEGGHNKELDDDFALYDPSKRTVIHAHNKPGNAFNGIDCNHYEPYGSVQKILKDSLIYMTTEFLHCQEDGGAGAGLEDYWELMWKSPRSGGGFLWALLDEAVVRTDQDNMLDAQMVNANDGILGPHREKEGSYYAIREIFSPIKLGFKVLPSGFRGSIPVENRFYFTNLNQCTFKWQLVEYYKPGESLKGHVVRQEGSQQGPDLAPFASGIVQLSLPDSWRFADALLLSVTDPSGTELMNWSFRIHSNADILASVIKKTGSKGSTYSQTNASSAFDEKIGGSYTQNTASQPDSLMSLNANGITVTFSKETGLIKQLRNQYSGNQLRFSNGPVMVAGSAKVREVKHYVQNDAQVIEFFYDGDMKYVKWTMYPSGWLEMDYSYSLNGQYDFTGISFNYPEKHIIGIRWLGNGPYRVWKNRPQGMTFDVWSKLYNNTQTGAFPWFYPEFKGYHSDMVWVEMNTVEGRFIMASNEENMFLRLFEFSAFSGTGAEIHPTLPKGDISFLDHIPATGTKMAITINGRPSDLGPMSQINQVNGTFTRKLYFYFGYPDSL